MVDETPEFDDIWERPGRFLLQEILLRAATREELSRLFGHFIIVHAQHLYASNAFEYTAYSKLFELVDRGEFIPAYRVDLTSDGKIEVERVDRR